jgi:hypothetical protein
MTLEEQRFLYGQLGTSREGTVACANVRGPLSQDSWTLVVRCLQASDGKRRLLRGCS